MYNDVVEITKSFPSKVQAVNFLMTLKAERILFVETDKDYKIVYAVERSIIDGEVISKEEEPPIITS